MTQTRKRRAFFSAFRKDPKPGETFLGVTAFARALLDIPGESWELEASTGTFKHLQGQGLPVVDLADRVGGPMFDHRVVTLSRQYHGGLLMDDTPEDWAELARINATLATDEQISMIHLVYCDPYPFLEVLDNPASTPAQIRAAIDIGGSAMIRAAAKMGKIVICRKDTQPQRVLEWLRAGRPDDEAFRNQLCWEAFAWSAEYDLAIARHYSNGVFDGITGEAVAECLYGENGYQKPARLHTTRSKDRFAVERFEVVAGKSPSFNNYGDLNRLLQTTTHLATGAEVNGVEDPFIVVIDKHHNPCGAAMGVDRLKVVRAAARGDTLSAFGGLAMISGTVDEEVADALLTEGMQPGGRQFFDGIIAASFTDGAIDHLKRKGDKCRFIANPALAHLGRDSRDTERLIRPVRGNFLTQPNYTFVMDMKNPNLKKYGQASRIQEIGMVFAWGIGATSNSNTIGLVECTEDLWWLVGLGVGQQDRVGAAELANRRRRRAGHKPLKCGVGYGDSFFPFPDGAQELVEARVRAILASSGSIRDNETIALCEEYEIPLYLIPDAEGRGFIH